MKKATEAFGGRPAVVMEATSHYHLILFSFFSDCGYDVLVVNPLQEQFHEGFFYTKEKNRQSRRIEAGHAVSHQNPTSIADPAICDSCFTVALPGTVELGVM